MVQRPRLLIDPATWQLRMRPRGWRRNAKPGRQGPKQVELLACRILRESYRMLRIFKKTRILCHTQASYSRTL